MKKAFTLIELLVVIGIIGVLAGLIVPSLSTSQMKARDTKRKSDLKQIQKALELYRQDQFPPKFPTNGNFLKWQSWSTYMSSVPYDPDSTNKTAGSGRISYSYDFDNTNLTFSLCACLENANDTLANGTDCNLPYNARTPCENGVSYTVNEP